MSINDPNLHLNKDVPVIVDKPGTDANEGANTKKEAPKIIFTRSQAEAGGWLDAFISADTDGSGDISEEELIKYNESHPENMINREEQGEVASDSKPNDAISEGVKADNTADAEDVPSDNPEGDNPEQVKIQLNEIRSAKISLGGREIKPNFNLSYSSMELTVERSNVTYQKDNYLKELKLLEGNIDLMTQNSREQFLKALKSGDFKDYKAFKSQLKFDINMKTSDKASYQREPEHKGRILNEEELNSALYIMNETLWVHAGMTREYAESMRDTRPEIYDLFEQICPDSKDVITEQDIKNYKQKELNKNGISYSSVEETLKNTTDPLKKMNIAAAMTGTGESSNVKYETLVDEKFKNVTNINTLLETLNISQDEWNNASPEEKTKLLSNKFLKEIEADLDTTNPDSKYYQELKRLEKGNYTAGEEKSGYSIGTGITGEEAKNLAIQNIIRSYRATVTHICNQVNINDTDESKALIANSLPNVLSGATNLREICEGVIVSSMQEGSVCQKETMNNLAQKETESGELDAKSSAGAYFVDGVYRYADENVIEKFVIDNQDQAEELNKIGQSTVESISDSDRKESIQNAIVSALIVIHEQNPNIIKDLDISYLKQANKFDELSTITSGTSNRISESTLGKNNSTSAQISTTGNQQNSSALANAVTNPIKNNLGFDINQLKALSKNRYPSEFVIPEQKQKEVFYSELEILYAQITSVSFTESEINAPPLEKLSTMCSQYNEMNDDDKVTFKNGLTRLKNSYPQEFCESYLHGNTTLKTFLKSEKLINDMDLFVHFDETKSDLVYADKTLTVNYNKYSSEKYKKEHGLA